MAERARESSARCPRPPKSRAAASWSSTTSPTSAKAWKRCSSQEGYRVELAANATEGLKRLEASAYDLVLLDLMMPDKSGMQVLEEIRARDRETPIFMITAYGSVEVAVRRAEARRQRLFLQALGQRKAADRDRPHDLEAPPGARKHRAQARPEAALQFPQHRRQERAHAQDSGPGRRRWPPAARPS